ncbi:MAG: YfhO family protein [Gemmataceae bacterium]
MLPTEHPRSHAERGNERWFLILTLVGSVFLLCVPAWPLLTRRIPIYYDLSVFHLPIRAFYSRCLAEGQSFDWCPHLYSGMFLSGEGEHGPYHPLHLFLYRFLPLDTAFALEAYLHVPLLFAGLFVFLRRYVRSTAALLGAFSYTFCCGSILHNIYPNYQGVMAHLPWILLLLDIACPPPALPAKRGGEGKAPRRRLALSAVALLTGSQVLLGSPQALSYSLFAEALFVLFLAWQRRPRWTFWLGWIVANSLGLLIGSVQLLATRDLLANSTRGGFDPMMGSLLPSQLAQLLAPNLLSQHLPPFACSEPLYFGAVPLLLGLWLLRNSPLASGARLNKETTEPDRSYLLAAFALVLGVLSGWLALGKYGYLYYLQTSLPLIGQFRLPGRYFTLVALAASILAAVAFDRLLAGLQTKPKDWRRHLWLPWTAVAAALVLALYFHLAYPKENGRGIHRNYFAGPLFLGAGALALTAAARGRRLGVVALVALAVVDLEVFSLKAPLWPHQSLWGGLPTLAEFRARAEPPPSPRPGRWLDSAFELPSPLLFDRPVLEGYHGGLEPRKLLDYRALAALRAAHTSWIHLSRWEKGGSFPELRRRGEYWYEVPAPLPRVRLVARAHVSESPAADIQRIDLEATALVTHSLELEEGEPGTARLIHEQAGEIAVRVAAPGRRLLVIADSFDPNWTAAVDDIPVTVERVNGDFLGCVVESGEHEVRFVFRPACIRRGLVLSLAGFALTVLSVGISCLQMFSRKEQMNRG